MYYLCYSNLNMYNTWGETDYIWNKKNNNWTVSPDLYSYFKLIIGECFANVFWNLMIKAQNWKDKHEFDVSCLGANFTVRAFVHLRGTSNSF